MVVKLKYFYFICFVAVTVISGGSVCTASDTCYSPIKKCFDFNVEAAKKTFYPGEPVLVSLKIHNTGKKDKVYLGDYKKFCSIIIRNHSGKTVSKGEIPYCPNMILNEFSVGTNKTAKVSIILNQWCSTLLSPGNYRVIFLFDYFFCSERKNNKPGPVHKIELSFDIQIIKMNAQEFKKILSDLAKHAFPQKERICLTGNERSKRDRCQEILAVVESDLAVPLQLKLLKIPWSPLAVQNTLSSLVRVGTPEVAKGLVQRFIECIEIVDEENNKALPAYVPTSHRGIYMFVKGEVLNAIYKLRDKGNLEIMKITEKIAKKYKRPLILPNID